MTGTAKFTPTITVNVIDSNIPLTTFTLPSNIKLPLDCNGKALDLPILPVTSVIKLHESTLPSGAAPAADTIITVGAEAVTTTIKNAKAAVVATPTPTPTAIVLPATGQPANTPGIPWPALALVGLIAMASAGLILRRRT